MVSGVLDWRAMGIDPPSAVLQRPLVILDLETTGLDARRDEIIQVALLKVLPDEDRLELWSSLVRPLGEVPPEVHRLTGITEEDLERSPAWPTVADAVRAFALDLPVAGHNVAFDLEFLARGGVRLRAALDTWDWSRIGFPARGNHRLADLGEDLGVGGRAHDARTDVLACYYVMAAVRRRVGATGEATRGLLRHLLGPAWSWWRFDDTNGDTKARAESALFRPAPEPPVTAPEPRPVAMGPIHVWFEEGGPLAAEHEGWQRRPGQAAMADAVEAALADRSILVAEAGTGVGKSLAYLMPAIRQAAYLGERVVVATHTLALQDQLWQKDVPEALRALGLEDVPRALVKGRARYVCLLKAEEETGGADLAWDWDERVAAASLVMWLVDTDSGERDDWSGGRAPAAQSLWEAVAADPDACAGPRCRYAGPCFLRSSRRAAEAANLVVTNHALLLAHAAQGGVLPPFQHLVVDEAHHLPEVADQALGLNLDLVRAARLLGEWAGPRGWVVKGRHLLARPGGSAASLADVLRDRLSVDAGLLQEAASALMDLGRVLKPEGSSAAGHTFTVRMVPAVRARVDEGTAGPALAAAGESLDRTAHQLADALAEADARLTAEERRRPRWLQWTRLTRVLQQWAQGIGAFLDHQDEWVDWWEWRADGASVTLRRAPLSPGAQLERVLWSQLSGGAVLTSATLTTAGRFDYLADQLGVNRGVGVTAYPSPFAAHEQALLAVPTDLPHPNDREHLTLVGDFVERLATRLGGRLMVLTTSRAAVHTLADRLAAPLARVGLELLVQGVDGSPHRLAAHLRQHPQSVVVGTSGLWEGVDVPGPSLAAVVVTRLPFAFPGDPLEEARGEMLRARGRSPFGARALPQAVLRFRQGFGRLLRTESDRGAVVVLDPRILPQDKSAAAAGYGRAFLSSLPGPQLVMADTSTVLDQVVRFAAAT
jgi:ATP-dependent DNA helicase DinG